MTQGFWGLYKARVLQALGEEVPGGGHGRAEPPGHPLPSPGGASLQGDPPELMEAAEPPVPAEEGPGPVAQLARKVQGVGARGWRSLSALFAREDEHRLLSPDHPLAASPAEPPPAPKPPGFWDLLATKWQQAAAPEPEEPPTTTEPGDSPGEPPGDEGPDDLREPEEGAFRWGFLACKLAEIRNKNAPKGN
ncbi:Testis development-related protein-like isoform X1 [Aix galericulata]|nr:Testis development-related protein-like isoform X1 [Aix galericulata]